MRFSMMSEGDETRALTDDERDRLQPLLDRTDIPVRVTAEPLIFFEDDDGTETFAAHAAGLRPRNRRVVFQETCFEDYSDEQLLGVFAHELGHHDGRHGLISACAKAGMIIFALLVVAGLWGGAIIWASSGEWGVLALGLLASALLFGLQTVGDGLFGKWKEYDATRRGALLLGETAPLEALYEPSAETESGPLWAELMYPYPHPADQLDRLRE
jgi:Zn-dependent protease with chaperone function